jgi:hypothetical protein
MFKWGVVTRASNGISGRNNVFEIFSQKSKRIMKNSRNINEKFHARR